MGEKEGAREVKQLNAVSCVADSKGLQSASVCVICVVEWAVVGCGERKGSVRGEVGCKQTMTKSLSEERHRNVPMNSAFEAVQASALVLR